MAKLRIKNFGPIREGFSENDGFMEITPVTVLCGNQATGKSTIAKLYSTLTWLEKALVKTSLGNNTISKTDFISFCSEQKLHEYFTNSTEIEYVGQIFKFIYKNSVFSQEMKENSNDVLLNYNRPKIIYIPSERNLLTVVDNAENINNIPLMLSILLEEYNKAKKKSSTGLFNLPISNVKLQYDNQTLSTKVVTDNGTIDILNSSSGIQSVAPISLVSRFLADDISSDFLKNLKRLSINEREQIKDWLKKGDNQVDREVTVSYFEQLLYGQTVTDSIKEKLSSVLHLFFNTCFINIVEEPEQNLYPDSQGNVLFELLECLNTNEHNQLIITTHSPYILSYLTQSAKAAELLESGVPPKEIDRIIPTKAAVAGIRISIYETNEDGSIRLLNTCEKLPSDKNLLNKALVESNEKFAELLELEEEFCQ